MERPKNWHYHDEAEHLAGLLRSSGADDEDLLEYVEMIISRGLKRDAERTGEFRTYRPHGKIKIITHYRVEIGICINDITKLFPIFSKRN